MRLTFVFHSSVRPRASKEYLVMEPPLEELLSKIYFTPSHAGSFTSARQVQRVLRDKYDKNVSLNVIQNWLQNQRSYNMHRHARKNFKRNPIVAHFIDQQWQGDLFFLPELAKFNDGTQAILVCIDVVSRFAWCEQMFDKSGKETARAFEAIIQKGSRKPEKFQTDDGKEFFNQHFSAVMAKYNINHFSIPSDKKAAIAERFVQTLKEKIHRYIDVNAGVVRYIDVLPDLVRSYNDTFHSKIKMAPSEVTAENEAEVLENLYSKDLWNKPREVPRLKVGDTVRISGGDAPFMKGYKGRWTEELFEIAKIKNASPRPLYKLRALDGEEIKGIFYEDEVQKVLKPTDDLWQVEKIVRTRIVRKGRRKIKQYFVKWFGYPENFNSWVNEDDVKDISNREINAPLPQK